MTIGEGLTGTTANPADIGRAVVDVATAWDARLAQAIGRGSTILALRGAGSVGGIDPEAADNVLDTVLIPQIEEDVSKRKPVAVVYDGDPDDPAKPDIGYVFGRLMDAFGGQRSVRNGAGVSFLTAQTSDWYAPAAPGDNLTNVHGLPIETFVFPRGVYAGDHNRFTQSDRLAAYPHYGQVYVGASGTLAAGQMEDYYRRAAGNHVNITVIRALINGALSAEIGDKLAQATTDAQREKFARMEEQRHRIYGKHWKNDGEFDPHVLEGLRSQDDTHELVVLWEAANRVDIVNCQKLDLGSAEINGLFDAAGYFIKTQPIKARQIPAGVTETVIVNSGATRDIARAGDWVCTSVGKGEEYVVHATDFPDIYEYIEGSDNSFIAKRDPRKLVKVGADVIFMAPWGEQQVVRRGGYLIERTIRSGPRAGQTERYGISQKDAEPDFVPLV